MSLTLYYAPMSTASITQLVVEELGVPCEMVKLDLKAGGAKTPEYLKLNPNGVVPCIVHDGVAIWESAAITIYLGEQFGTAKQLWPEAGPHRGEAMKWVVWTNVTVGEAMWRRRRAEHTDDNAYAEASADLDRLLAILDGGLDGKQFLAGDYSLADAHVCSITDWMRYSKVDFSKHANINAWAERCHARPAVKKVMAG